MGILQAVARPLLRNVNPMISNPIWNGVLAIEGFFGSLFKKSKGAEEGGPK